MYKMKNIKNIKAFTMIEMLVVLIILGILVLIVPRMDAFYLNSVKKEGVLLARTVIERERIYKADNGNYFEFDAHDTDKIEEIQNWKSIKTLLTDNKYFRPERQSGEEYQTDLSEIVIESVKYEKQNQNNKLEVVVRASPYSRVAGWKIKGILIEEPGEKPKIKFQEFNPKSASEGGTDNIYKDIAL